MHPHLQRALMLLEQSRCEMAEEELRASLSQHPDDAMAHAILAVCLAELEKFAEASQEAGLALHQWQYATQMDFLLARGGPTPDEMQLFLADKGQAVDAEQASLINPCGGRMRRPRSMSLLCSVLLIERINRMNAIVWFAFTTCSTVAPSWIATSGHVWMQT